MIWGEDPRKAKTLEEAAQNFDGTFNGPRLLAWLTGMTEAEARELVEETAVVRRKVAP